MVSELRDSRLSEDIEQLDLDLGLSGLRHHSK